MRVLSSLGLALFLSAVAGSAAAAGLQLLPGGNQSVARGGAVAGRAEDPMVLANDPAGLAYLGGHHQVLLELIAPIQHMCVDPYGSYGWGAYSAGPSEFGNPLELDNPKNPTPGATYASTPLPKVCNSAPTSALPNIAWAGKITDRLGIGAGIVAPVLVPGVQYGGNDGTIQTPYGPRPTPTRYSLVKQEVPNALTGAFGIGYKILPQLSAGMTFQFLYVHARAVAVQNEAAGTQPSSDWLATVDTHDYFIPTFTFSVHAKPIRPVDMVVAFHYSDDFRGSGTVTYETNTFHRGATGSDPAPHKNAPIDLKEVRVGLPWSLTGAVRYAGLLSRADKPQGIGDPMDTELWDVEVDVAAELDGQARNSVDVGGDVTVRTATADGKLNPPTTASVSSLELDPHRKTAYTARLGGSYSVVPRRFTVHAGSFYESASVQKAYADVDTFAFQRVGLGLGGVVRLGSFDLRFAYSHIFSETLDLAPPPHQNVENARPGDPTSGFDQRVGGTFGPDGTRRGGVVLPDPAAPTPGGGDATARKTQSSAVSTDARPERVINAGKYTASFDVISVGAVYHF